jgi:hypothetical protein
MVNKTHTIARAIGQSRRKQAEYAKGRSEYTAEWLVKTSKPRKKKVRPAEVEKLKNRVESVEGSEVVETIINTLGEAPIQDKAEVSMQHLWNGA